MSRDLTDSAKVVKPYVDERLAHTTPGSTATLSWPQLKDAIHEVSAIFQRIGVILNATHYEYSPVIQEPWEAVFSAPLFPDR